MLRESRLLAERGHQALADAEEARQRAETAFEQSLEALKRADGLRKEPSLLAWLRHEE